MKWRRTSAETESAELAQARKRVAKMSTHDLLNWADMAGSGMAKGFDDYRRLGMAESLEEIQMGLVSLQAVADELTARHEDE